MLEKFNKKLYSFSIFTLCTFLFFICLSVYFNSFFNGLFFDDEHFIYKNTAVISFSLSNIFSQSMTTGAGQLSNYYRPLLFTGFAIEYALFGASGFIYHFSSFFLHALSGILIYLLLQSLFKNRFISLLTAVLFLIHPIQTEAISYASGRGDPQSFFFSLLAIYLLLKKSMKAYMFSVFFFICALLSKEIALITPGLMFVVILFTQQSLSKKTILKSLKKTFLFFLITVIYFSLRLSVLNFANTLNFSNSQTLYTQNILVRLITFFHYAWDYIKLLIVPHPLFMERDITISVQSRPTFLSLLAIFAIASSFIFGIIRRVSHPILLFSLLWIGISFIPTSGIIPINGIFYEHFLYYPSLGFFLLFSYFISLLLKKCSSFYQYILLIFLFLYLSFFMFKTIERNTHWKDPITFYNQTLLYAKSARILNNLAMAYAENGETTKAIKAYTDAIAIEDYHPETRYNLGNLFLSQENLIAAEKEYKEALRIDPTFYYAYQRLMEIYIYKNDTEGKEWVLNSVSILSQKNAVFLPLLKQLETF